MGTAISLGGDLLHLSVSVGQSNAHLFGAQHDALPITMNKRAKKTDDIDSCLPLECRNALCDLSAVGSVVHEEQFNVGFVSEQELLQAAREEVSRSSCLLASNCWHTDTPSELTPDDAINTSWLPPGFLQKHS